MCIVVIWIDVIIVYHVIKHDDKEYCTDEKRGSIKFKHSEIEVSWNDQLTISIVIYFRNYDFYILRFICDILYEM